MIFCGYFIFSDDGKSRVQLSAAVGFYVESSFCADLSLNVTSVSSQIDVVAIKNT